MRSEPSSVKMLFYRYDANFAQYTIKRSKTLRGFAGPDWEEKNVSQLNHALEALMDGLPPHRTIPPLSPFAGQLIEIK
jgi:hypothetical protein